MFESINWISNCRIECLNCRIEGLNWQIEDLNCRIEGLNCRIECLNWPIECLNWMIASLDCKIECLNWRFGFNNNKFEFWRGWIPILVQLHATCCDENASGHHHYNKMQYSHGDSTCQVVNKIIRSPNRQTCKGSLLLMRCNFRMENTICQIEHNIFHSSNRTNRNSTCRVVNYYRYSRWQRCNNRNAEESMTCKMWQGYSGNKSVLAS